MSHMTERKAQLLEPCVFTSCSMTCLLVDGQRCEVTEAVKLHVKLLSFSWDDEFKVLRGGPFPAKGNPYFVWERLIRDLIIFNFQGEGQPLRAYTDQVFRAASFLEYDANEQQLVDRIVMNFHPSILAHAAFLDKPRSLKELYRVVGLIEQKFAVAKERQ